MFMDGNVELLINHDSQERKWNSPFRWYPSPVVCDCFRFQCIWAIPVLLAYGLCTSQFALV